MSVVYISKTQRVIGLFAGLALIGMGVIATLKLSDYTGFIRLPVNPIGFALMAVGAFIFASGFFGCCGVGRGHFCAVVFFATLLCLLLFGQVAMICLGVVFETQTTRLLQSLLESTMTKYNVDDGLTSAWDRLQSDFQCCGTVDYSDWQTISLTPPFNSSVFSNGSSYHDNDSVVISNSASTLSVPDSCCIPLLQHIGCGWDVISRLGNIHVEGCVSAIRRWISDNLTVIIAFCVATIAIQMTGILLAVSLARNIRHQLMRSRGRRRSKASPPLL